MISAQEEKGEPMSDLINRHLAIDAIDQYNVNGWVEERFEDLEKALLDVPSSVNQWIPCSKRLPEVGGAYFVTGKMKYAHEKKWLYFTDVAYNFGNYIDNYWGTCNDWDEGQEIHIIAWMPLPKPWTGEAQ